MWLTDHTQRGRISDLVDDVFVFASRRYFKGEIVEAVVNDQVFHFQSKHSTSLIQRPWLIPNRSRGLICGVPMMKSVTFFFLQWCDCKVLRVIPPTQAEIDADVEAEREEQLKEEKEKQVWSLNQKC